MKHLHESILDDNFTGYDIGVIDSQDIIQGAGNTISDDKEIPIFFLLNKKFNNSVSDFVKTVFPERIKLHPDIILKILKRKRGWISPWKCLSDEEKENIKERAHDWFMSQLNSAGEELVKLHKLTVKLSTSVVWNGRPEIDFYIGQCRVMAIDFRDLNIEELKKITQAPS